MSLVTLDVAEGLATLTLNRPDKLNALTTPMLREMRVLLERIAADRGIRCVVLAGAGRSFCAGHDLGDLGAEDAFGDRYFEAETIDCLEALPQPTIARLQGHCLTGGLELALACDMLVADTNTRFGDTHGKWGVVPIWGLSVRLPERIGRGPAATLMYTSRIIDGREAHAIGLVDRVVAPADLDRAVRELADGVLANSPGSNRIVKSLLAAHAGRLRAEALRFERDLPFGLPDDMAQRLAAPSPGGAGKSSSSA